MYINPGPACGSTFLVYNYLFYIEVNGEDPEYLQQVMIPYITKETCKEWYTSYDVPDITANMLCAGYEEEGRSGCHVRTWI